jgi:hypothetical protein
VRTIELLFVLIRRDYARAQIHPAANEESASPAYAPPSGDLPSHHAQTGKGQRYLFVPTTLAGKRASEVDATNGITAKSGRLPRGENGTNMTHWGQSATREHPPAHPTYSGPARLTINAFAEAAPSGIYAVAAMHICFRSRPKRFIDELCLPP